MKMRLLLTRVLAMAVVATAFLSPGAPVLADEWSLKTALRQIDSATKGIGGLTGQVTATDQRGEEISTLEGEVAVMMDGRMRIAIGSEPPRVILCTGGKMYVHEPARSLVTEHKLGKNPESLQQYALVGFSPAGTGLEKEHLVTLVEESMLDGAAVLMFELTPKSADLREAIQKIHLWVDQASWLPLQQRIFHTAADTHLTIRYEGLSRNDRIDTKLFAPKWPKGTRKEKAK